MSALTRKLSFLLLGLSLAAHAPSIEGQGASSEDTGLTRKIADFELTDGTVLDGLAKLSSESTPLALGFEAVLRGEFSDPPLPDPRFSLKLQGRTLREILDTLCSMDSRYTWSRDGATINVYPRATIADSDYFLNYKLSKLEIKVAPDPGEALGAIVDLLPGRRQPIGYVQVGGDFSYAKPWTVTFKNLTVRQAINRLAAHMGPRSSWIFFGAQDYKAFTFHKGEFRTGSQTPQESP